MLSSISLELHRAIPHRLLAAIRTVQLHGAANAAAATAIQRCHAALEAVLAISAGPLTLQFIDQILVVNEVRVSLGASKDSALAPLFDAFHARGLGGIRVFGTVTEVTLKDWLIVFCQPVHDEIEAASLRNVLVRIAHIGVETLEPKTLACVQRQETAEPASMGSLLETYARAIVGFRELVGALRGSQDPFRGRINVVRVVRDLIEIGTARPDLLLRLLERRRDHAAALEEGYAEVHAANTALYAILIGRLLEFDRVSLLDLGTSALLADVGFAILPEELTERRGALSPEQRLELKKFMRRSVQTLIGRGRVNDAMLRRVIVAYEHHYPYVHPVSKDRTLTHIYSRIVAVADAFDALMSRRAWREPMTMEAALEVLRAEAGSRYDPAIVTALSALVTARPQLHPEHLVC
jgi:HD-GYP domain-containing protein (c-di-GMP phosphodiesterase class II)